MWSYLRPKNNQEQTAPAGEDGQSTVEFAFTIPIFTILLVAMLVVAWMGFIYVSITNGARQGARWMLNYPPRPTEPIDPSYSSVDEEIEDVVKSAMPALDPSATTVHISPPPPDRYFPNQVEVQVVYLVNLPTIRIPYIFVEGGLTVSQPMQLQATSRMTLE
jgi:hypothetical protein